MAPGTESRGNKSLGGGGVAKSRKSKFYFNYVKLEVKSLTCQRWAKGLAEIFVGGNLTVDLGQPLENGGS